MEADAKGLRNRTDLGKRRMTMSSNNTKQRGDVVDFDHMAVAVMRKDLDIESRLN